MTSTDKTLPFSIPTSQELQYSFLGSVDLNHIFHQFEWDEESKDLFVFYGPDGTLLRYYILVTGTFSASSENQEHIQRMVDGLKECSRLKIMWEYMA